MRNHRVVVKSEENSFAEKVLVTSRPFTRMAWRTRWRSVYARSASVWYRCTTYNIGIPLLLSNQSIDLSLRLLPSGRGHARQRRGDSAGVGSGEALNDVAEEATRRTGGLLAIEESGGESLGAWALRRLVGRLGRAGRRREGGRRCARGGGGLRSSLSGGLLECALVSRGVDGALLFDVLRVERFDGEHCAGDVECVFERL